MLKKGMKKGVAGLIVATLSMSMLLSGCGSKTEDFGDYGTISDSADSAEQDDNGDTSDDSVDSGSEKKTKSDDGSKASAIEEGFLSEKLGLTKGETQIQYSGDFEAGGKTVGINFSGVIEDTDSLPTYKVKEIKEEDVHESEIVDKVFGGAGVPLNTEDRKFLNTEQGDSDMVISYCSSISYRNGDESSWQRTRTWIENENYFLHIYEGKINEADYQLVISYSKKFHEKAVCLYPKNFGDVSGDSDVKGIGISDPNGMFYYYQMGSGIKEYDLNTIMADRPNVCTLNDDELYDKIISTINDQCFMNVPKEGINFASSLYGREYMPEMTAELKAKGAKSEMVLLKEEELDDPNLPGASRNGYVATYMGRLGNQDIIDSMDDIGYCGDDIDYSMFYVNDSGLIAYSICSSYNFEEMLSENVSVLELEDGMKAFEKAMSENFDISKTDIAEKAEFNKMEIKYCPMPIPDGAPDEYYLVPCWVGTIDKAGSTKAMGVISAVDGTFIKVAY